MVRKRFAESEPARRNVRCGIGGRPRRADAHAVPVAEAARCVPCRCFWSKKSIVISVSVLARPQGQRQALRHCRFPPAAGMHSSMGRNARARSLHLGGQADARRGLERMRRASAQCMPRFSRRTSGRTQASSMPHRNDFAPHWQKPKQPCGCSAERGRAGCAMPPFPDPRPRRPETSGLRRHAPPAS